MGAEKIEFFIKKPVNPKKLSTRIKEIGDVKEKKMNKNYKDRAPLETISANIPRSNICEIH
ncbi:MAG: hypothetical protein K0M45_01570 [Candidatus Paracaedibacteraceae bacterium]|nr:hypothetical protein [Candidatus Paracaedibacteraceae bacterium]